MLSSSSPPTPKSIGSCSGLSLNDHFKEFLKLKNSLDDVDSEATRLTEILLELKFKMEYLNLFSLNESLSDLNSNDMKYLSIYCYLGIYLQSAKTSLDREIILAKCKEYFVTFLDLMAAYELMTDDDSKWLQNVLNGFKPRGDAIRMAKIAQYKREKTCKEKESQLKELLEVCGEEDDTLDLEKDLIVTTLDLLVQTAINSIKEIGDEMEMIEFGRKMKSMNSHSTSKSAMQASESTLDARQSRKVAQYSGPMLSKDGKPLRPFLITTEHNKRQELANGVFRPGHSLPTMTIDEYLDREMERGNFLSGGTEPPKKKEIGDLDWEAQDEEAYKQRDWDEFKDHNPAGWGNRYKKG